MGRVTAVTRVAIEVQTSSSSIVFQQQHCIGSCTIALLTLQLSLPRVSLHFYTVQSVFVQCVYTLCSVYLFSVSIHCVVCICLVCLYTVYLFSVYIHCVFMITSYQLILLVRCRVSVTLGSVPDNSPRLVTLCCFATL